MGEPRGILKPLIMAGLVGGALVLQLVADVSRSLRRRIERARRG